MQLLFQHGKYGGLVVAVGAAITMAANPASAQPRNPLWMRRFKRVLLRHGRRQMHRLRAHAHKSPRQKRAPKVRRKQEME